MRAHTRPHWPKHGCWADHIWFCCTLAIAVNGALQQSSRAGGRVAGLFTQDGHHTDWDWEQHPNSHGGDSCKQFERGKIGLELQKLACTSSTALHFPSSFAQVHFEGWIKLLWNLLRGIDIKQSGKRPISHTNPKHETQPHFFSRRTCVACQESGGGASGQNCLKIKQDSLPMSALWAHDLSTWLNNQIHSCPTPRKGTFWNHSSYARPSQLCTWCHHCSFPSRPNRSVSQVPLPHLCDHQDPNTSVPAGKFLHRSILLRSRKNTWSGNCTSPIALCSLELPHIVPLWVELPTGHN